MPTRSCWRLVWLTSWGPLCPPILSLAALGGLCVCVCVVNIRERDIHIFTVSYFLLTLRTAVNSQTGVCTPAGGIVTSESSHLPLWMYLLCPPVAGLCFYILFPSLISLHSPLDLLCWGMLSWMTEVDFWKCQKLFSKDNKNGEDLKQSQSSIWPTNVVT